MIYSQWSVVVIPYPFSDRRWTKRRPAVVLSDSLAMGESVTDQVMAMITTTLHEPWPLDVRITDLRSAGLRAESVVRMKLFSLDYRNVTQHLGSLSVPDQTSVSASMRTLLGLA